MNKIKRVVKYLIILCLLVSVYVKGGISLQASLESALKISGYSTVSALSEGQSFIVKGILSSNYKITKVSACITTSKGSIQFEKSVKPNTRTYDLAGIDAAMRFGSLGVGSYIFKVEAEDASGNAKTLLAQNFIVQSNIKVTGYNSLVTLKRGQAFRVKGIVSSKYAITKVTACITSSKGKVQYKKSVIPNKTSYDLSALNGALCFNMLAEGDYVFKIDATDKSKTSKNLLKQNFNVISANATVEKVAGTANWLSNCKEALEYYADNGFSYGTASPYYVAPLTINKKTNCAAYVSWCLYRNGYITDLKASNQFAQGTAAYVNRLGWEMNTYKNSIKAGDIVYYSQRNLTESARMKAIKWLKNHGPNSAGSGMHVDICYDPLKKQFLSAGSNTYIKTGKIATYGSVYLEKHFVCSFRYPD